MPHNFMLDPWKINDSDGEDEINNRHNRSISVPPKPSTLKVLARQNEIKTPNWNPVMNEEGHKRKFGRQKTAPSFEQAPSNHKPIFSGPTRLKSSTSSLFSLSKSLFAKNKTIVTNTPDTAPASSLILDANFDPIKFIQEDLTKFIYTHIPKEYPFIHCCVRRDKSGLHKGFFPTYYLHTEPPGGGRKIFLLAARKVAKINRRSEYLITTDIETLSERSGGDGFVGKLRSNNLTGAEYTLYDSGKSPNKYGYKRIHSKCGLRRELAAIIYNTHLLSFKGPQEMNAVIPKLEHEIQPAQEEDTILDRWRDEQFTDLLQLRTRSPKDIEETEAHMLQFTGNSVIQPSGKNFHMVIENENHEEEVVMQFGRINHDTFTCDFRYPLSTIQAFGIALSSFDSGLSRE